MQPEKSLFDTFRLNTTITLKNRIVMAPMTRAMAQDDLTPTSAMANYYARRSDAGLIITEGTIIRPDGLGYRNVAGIYNENHIRGWRVVTEAVHKNDGSIFLQIWHVGRVSHPSLLNGELPLAPSETRMQDKVRRAENLTYAQSRAVTQQEISDLVNSYAQAAKNAMAAGFDGVEIHGANGYLIDQFLHYSTNHRQDEYGGSAENMARFALEIIKACGDAIGYERVGIRLSPAGYLHEIVTDLRDADTFKYLLQQLNHLNIAYVHTGNNNDIKQFAELNNMTMTEFIRFYYNGNLIACGNYNFSDAKFGIKEHKFDLIAFGRPFIANPDLVTRLKMKKYIKSYNVEMLQELY